MKKIALIIWYGLIFGGCAYPGPKMDDNRVGEQRIRPIEITPEILRTQAIRDQAQFADLRARDLQTSEDPYVYRVGPQDVLNITVWDHPELTIPAGQFRSAEDAGHLVAEDGTIFYPFIGTARVAGMTVAQIRNMLTDRLSGNIRNPQLDVRVAAFRSQRVYVVGEVNEPGVQAITDIALTAVEAISQAGDVTANSDMKNVTLTRDNITYDIDLVSMYELGATDQNIILQDGDILNVPDRNLQKVFVLGSVNSPSTQIIHKGRLSLAEAISDAGGFDETGSNPSQVFVVRGGEIEPQIYHIDARSPGALVIADSFQLQARDIVYVERSGEVRLAERLERLSVLTRMVNDIADTRIRVVEDLN